MRKLGILICLFVVQVSQGKPVATNICDLLKSPNVYDAKTVIVTGFVYADRHSTGIEGQGCFGGIVVRYDSATMPKEFVQRVETKRSHLDARPFRVTLEGKFNARVREPLGLLRRLEATKAIKWGFVGEKE